MAAEAAEFTPPIDERALPDDLLNVEMIVPAGLMLNLVAGELPDDTEVGLALVGAMRNVVVDRSRELVSSYRRTVNSDNVRLASSEMGTNAQLHGGGIRAAMIGITATRLSLLVGYEDKPAWGESGRSSEADEYDEYGNGYTLVRSISDNSGFSYCRAASGLLVSKIVWAEFPTSPIPRQRSQRAAATTARNRGQVSNQAA